MINKNKLKGESEGRKSRPGIGSLVASALWIWGRSGPRRMLFFLRIAWRLWRAKRRHHRRQCDISGQIPTVVAISLTMRCNYSCQGCYSRGRPTEDELTTGELDNLFTEAEELGVPVMVVTGGEPLLRSDLLELTARHRRLLFVMISNGFLVTPEIARCITRSSNLIPLISIEGFNSDTDGRRRAGAHDSAVNAMKCLHEAGACFGFAAMNTAVNTSHLGTDVFLDSMIRLGCSVGFFTEYIPCGLNPRLDWVLDEAERAAFRSQVLHLRNSKPIVLVQFPQDEYGEHNRCSAAGQASLHINSQGGVEPCPFVPVACVNIRRGGLMAACQSPFLQAIRQRPDLLKRQRLACSLFEHLPEIEALALKFKQEPEKATKGVPNPGTPLT